MLLVPCVCVFTCVCVRVRADPTHHITISLDALRTNLKILNLQSSTNHFYVLIFQFMPQITQQSLIIPVPRTKYDNKATIGHRSAPVDMIHACLNTLSVLVYFCQYNYIQLVSTYTHAHTCIHKSMLIHTQTHMRTHEQQHTHTRTYTHKRKHTQTHTHLQPQVSVSNSLLCSE